MKIALVLERMDPSRGGMETYVSQVAPLLAQRGHEVSIICQQARWTAPRVTIVPLGRRGGFRVQRLPNFLADMRTHLATNKYDIVHAMLPLPGCNIYQPHGGTIPMARSAALRRRCGLSRLAAAIGQRFNLVRRQLAAMEKHVVADQRVICLAVSDMVARQFADFYGRSSNVRTVFNGASVPDVEPATRAAWRARIREQIDAGPDETIFLTVATNFELKGVPELLRAFAQWQRRPNAPPARLVIIGREKPVKYIHLAEKLNVGATVMGKSGCFDLPMAVPASQHTAIADANSASSMTVAPRVIFIPPTPDLFPWYSAADACVLLSWYDSCSLVVLEAVRWGLPALTTAYNGAADALSAGTGLIVRSPADTPAIISAFDTLCNTARRLAFSQACSALSPRLTVEGHVDELTRVYAEVTR